MTDRIDVSPCYVAKSTSGAIQHEILKMNSLIESMWMLRSAVDELTVEVRMIRTFVDTVIKEKLSDE